MPGVSRPHPEAGRQEGRPPARVGVRQCATVEHQKIDSDIRIKWSAAPFIFSVLVGTETQRNEQVEHEGAVPDMSMYCMGEEQE